MVAVVEAAVWGILAASSLIFAAEVAFVARLGRMTIGLIMAFGVGALIASVAFELVEPALDASELWKVAAGLAAGSIAFFAGDVAIGRLARRQRSRPEGDRGGDESETGGVNDEGGLGIVLGTVLDGVPESAVLGMSLVGGGGVSVALLAGIWVSNLPEALGSTVSMVKTGWTRTRVRLLWWAVVAGSGLAAAAGFVIVDNSSGLNGTLIEAFAAGALLTMIADEMAPDAYDRSHNYAGLATVAGFATAIWLSALE